VGFPHKACGAVASVASVATVLENTVVKNTRMSIQESAQAATYVVSVIVVLCLRTGSGCDF
jgi:hypothetical protein